MKLFKFASILWAASVVPGAAASYLTSGHVDTIGIGWNGSSLYAFHHVDAGAVVDGELTSVRADYAPSELITVGGESAYNSIPSGFNPTYAAMMGVESGGGLWILPATQQAGLPFAGLSTESLNAADWVSDFTISLVSVDGPGEFSMWQPGSFSTLNFLISTADGGITGADQLTARAGSHIHYNWGFTEPGTYDITFQIDGTHATAGAQTTTATYTFNIIPEPSVALLGAIGALGLLRRRR